MGKLERTIQAAIRKDLGLVPALVLWRNQRGHTVEWGEDGRARHITYGLAPGASDLIGIYRGRFIAFEVKQPGEDLTNDQAAFLEAVRFNGGFGCRVDSVQAARSALVRCANGESE